MFLFIVLHYNIFTTNFELPIKNVLNYFLNNYGINMDLLLKCGQY